MKVRGWATILLCCGLLGAGCNRARHDAEAAQEVIARFFAALPTAGCDELEPLLLLPPETTCEEAVEEMRSHGLALLQIESAYPDGRDRDAVLVRARMAKDGKEMSRASLLRVERRDGRWRYRP